MVTCGVQVAVVHHGQHSGFSCHDQGKDLVGEEWEKLVALTLVDQRYFWSVLTFTLWRGGGVLVGASQQFGAPRVQIRGM